MKTTILFCRTHLPLLSTILLISASFAQADTVTLRMNYTTTPSKVIRLAEGQIARLTHFYCFPTKPQPGDQTYISSDIALTVTFDDLTVQYTHEALFGKQNPGYYYGVALSRMPEFVGPAVIKLDFSALGAGRPAAAICTLEITQISVNAAIADGDIKPPTIAPLVVPEKDGPVEILLESSTDMEKTWQPAAAGVYGTAAKRRFFRLRAVRRM